MKGLLLKDIAYLKPGQTIGFMLICSIMFLVDDVLLAMSYVVLVASIFSQLTFTYDEQMGTMKYILTLPVTRAQYAGSKYIFVLGIHGCTLLTGMVLRLLLRREMAGLFAWLGLGVALYMASTALLVPLFLVLHGKRREIVMTVVVLLPFMLMLLRQRLGWLTEVSVPSGGLLLPMLLGGLLLLAVSYRVSLRIMDKKEY